MSIERNFGGDTDGDKMEGGEGMMTKFVWRIRNVSDRMEKVGECFDSNTFMVLSSNENITEWKLMLFPKGKRDADGGHLVVHLRILGAKTRARFKIFIVNSHGKKIKTSGYVEREFEDTKSFGVRFRLSYDQLKEKNFIVDNVLTLFCEVMVLENAKDFNYNHRVQMFEDLEKAFKDKDKNFFNCKVKCEGGSFESNTFMLAARCPYFKAMFQHNTEENQTKVVNLKEIEPDVLEEMLRYIHTGKAPNIKHIAKELLVAAGYYQLDQLEISCQEALIETMNVDNSIELLKLSDTHSSQLLKKKALEFVVENWKSIKGASDWEKELAGYPTLTAEILKNL